jgi:hypothetical protein
MGYSWFLIGLGLFLMIIFGTGAYKSITDKLWGQQGWFGGNSGPFGLG